MRGDASLVPAPPYATPLPLCDCRQRTEMDEALSGGIGARPFSDTQISNLAQGQIENLEVISSCVGICPF